MMSTYEQSKTARRVASVVYLLIMAVILAGTFWSNHEKELAAQQAKEAAQVTAIPAD